MSTDDSSRRINAKKEYRRTIPDPNPSGLCMCGCGKPVYRGARYLAGHHTRKSPVDYVVDPDTGCWEWQLTKNDHGYGQGKIKQKRFLAHRLYWERENGPIPEGLCVLHRCDNPGCVNPEHLFLGTKQDNSRDMTSKGRGHYCPGDDHPGARLSDSTVAEIRRRCSAGALQRVVAEQYGVSPSLVSQVVRGVIWKDTFEPSTRRVEPTITDYLAQYSVDDGTGCWNWIGDFNNWGYGYFHMNGRTCVAHRTAFEFLCRPLERGERVYHTCENRACVNPNHLVAARSRSEVQRLVQQARTRSMEC